jgi:hypothetical protein
MAVAMIHRYLRFGFAACFTLSYLACGQLPFLEEGVCGNRVVDAEKGEQCDGEPRLGERPCRAPGLPGECQFECTAQNPCPAGQLCNESLQVCEPASEICGNRSIEAGEDCDGPGEWPCYGPGEAAACRFDCSTDPCKKGYVCGLDKVCRQPSGTVAHVSSETVQSLGLLHAELDGDGRADIVRMAADGMHLHFPGEALALTSSLNIPLVSGARELPIFGDLDGDQTDEIAVALPSPIKPTSNAMAVYRLTQDRKVRPALFPTISFPSTPLAILGNFGPPTWDDELLVLSGTKADGLRFASPSSSQVLFEQNAAEVIGFTAASFAGVDNLPCKAVAIARKTSNGDSIALAIPCQVDGSWDSQPSQSLPSRVTLPEATLLTSKSAAVTRGGVVHAADPNGDGILDLVINTGTGSLMATPQVAYGLSDGSFHSQDPLTQPPAASGDGQAAAWDIKTGDTSPCTKVAKSNPIAGQLLHVGPLNDDNLSDIVTSYAVFTATNTSTFSPVACAAQPWAEAVVGDFNGDGHRDVAAARLKSSTTNIDVLLGNGQGNYTPVTLASGEGPSQLVAADFDSNGIDDLAFVARDEAVGSEQVAVWIAYGSNLGFSDAISLGLLPNPTATIAGRLNNDGSADLVVATDTELVVLSGGSSRLMVAPRHFRIGSDPTECQSVVAASVGRFDGASGKLAVLTGAGSNKVNRAWLVSTDPNLQLITNDPPKADLSCSSCRSAAIDVDGDGKDELLVVDSESPSFRLLTSESGTFVNADETSLPSEMQPSPKTDPWLSLRGRIRVADIDGDGDQDVAYLSSQSKLIILWNEGGLNPSEASVLSASDLKIQAEGASINDIAWFDADGIEPKEWVVVHDGGAQLVFMQGREVLSSNALQSVQGGWNVVAADFSGDGMDDLAVGTATSLRLYRGVATDP